MDRRAFINALPVIAGTLIMPRHFFPEKLSMRADDFRIRVYRIAKERFPEVNFDVPEDDPGILRANGWRIGLLNLKSGFDLSDQRESTLRSLVEDLLARVSVTESRVPSFETASSRLRPQIIPPGYVAQAPILTFPFGDSLVVGVVLDDEQGDFYLKREDADHWGKEPADLLDIAVANLDEASRDLPLTASESDEVRFVAIGTKDGFDAARILLPKLRRAVSDLLGSPFYFGIPNRDFLICWNIDASKRFADFTKEKIRRDFDSQANPLSPSFFEANATGRIKEHDWL